MSDFSFLMYSRKMSLSLPLYISHTFGIFIKGSLRIPFLTCMSRIFHNVVVCHIPFIFFSSNCKYTFSFVPFLYIYFLHLLTHTSLFMTFNTDINTLLTNLLFFFSRTKGRRTLTVNDAFVNVFMWIHCICEGKR